MSNKKIEEIINQDEIDNLLRVANFVKKSSKSKHNFIGEIKAAVLDSGKLNIDEWKSLRSGLKEMEELIPHIDLIIKLKEEIDENGK